MNAVNENLEKLKAEVHEELRNFGQYLAMRGAATGEQRFGVPEASMAVLSLIVWAIGKYVSSYVAERAKLDATKRKKKLNDRIGEIEASLQRIQEDLRTIRDGPSVAPGLIINRSDGSAELVGMNAAQTAEEQLNIARTDLMLQSLLPALQRERE